MGHQNREVPEHSGWTANPDGTVGSGFEERPDFFSSVAFWYQQDVNEGLPEPPYGYERLPFGNATQLEVPTLIKDVTAEMGKALVQKEVDWAKDLLFLDAAGPGARINIPVDIPEDGQYELIGLIALAPDLRRLQSAARRSAHESGSAPGRDFGGSISRARSVLQLFAGSLRRQGPRFRDGETYKRKTHDELYLCREGPSTRSR